MNRILQILYIVFIVHCASNKDNVKDSIGEFNANHRTYRIGVIDFLNTEKSKTKYDTLIPDLLIVELSKSKSNVLIERTKLSEILRENSLQNSGIIDSESAKSIGKILPVDLILTGSYTIQKSNSSDEVFISGRFIHVVTGEIVYAFGGNLFGSKSESIASKEEKEISNDSKCNENSNIEKSLKDLTDESKVNAIVAKSIQIPFDINCGKIHSQILERFTRYKFYPIEYKKFLIGSLKNIEFPNEDYRTMDILRYFHSDKKIDEDEWESGKEIIQRASLGYFSSYMRHLFNNENENSSLVLKRVDEIMLLAKSKKIGRPVIFEEQDILLIVFQGLRFSSGNIDPTLNTLKVFDKYKLIAINSNAEPKKIYRLYDHIKEQYFNESERDKKDAIFSRVKIFLESTSLTQEKEKRLDDLIGSLGAYAEKYGEVHSNLYKKHAIFIFNSLKKEICPVLEKSPYSYEKKRRIDFLEKNNLKCN